MGPMFRPLVACALLLVPATTWGDGTQTPASQPDRGSDARSAPTGLAEARALMNARRHDEALAILRPLVKSPRIEADVLFLAGLAALEASQRPGRSRQVRNTLQDAAIASFRALLVGRPGLDRVRLELGRAFFLKGEDELAGLQFERVLASEPPAAVAANVNRFLRLIRARRRWSVHLGFAIAPDSNIGQASDERIIDIDGLPFRRNAEDLTTSGVGLSAWASGEYLFPLAERLRLRAGGQAFRRDYKGKMFDQMTLSTHLGPRWRIGRDTEASLLASARQNWLSDAPEYRDFGFRAEAWSRFGRRVKANISVAHHARRYRARTHLDGPVTDSSLGVSYLASPTVRLQTAAGWRRQRTQRLTFRHTRRWVRIGMAVALPLGFTVGGSGLLLWADYEGNWFPFTDGGSRRDLLRSFRVFAHHRALVLKGFSPEISIVHETRATNAQLYDYRRTFGEVRFVRPF